jgi:ABC-type multidrug transport system fused ATPase/permease subunit
LTSFGKTSEKATPKVGPKESPLVSKLKNFKQRFGLKKKTRKEGGPLFGKSMLNDLKNKEEMKNSMHMSQMRHLSSNNLDMIDADLANSKGFVILSSLVTGMKRLLKKKTEGRLVSKWVEDDVYANLLKMVGRYIFLLGKSRILLQFILFAISTTLFIGIDFWTGAWSNRIYDLDRNSYMAIYLIISIGASTVVFFRDILFYRIIMKNSRSLHQKAMKSLINVNQEWLDLYPDARIEFKLSYDMRKIDEYINNHIQILIEAFVFCVGGMLMLNYVYIGIMFVTTLFLGIYLYYILSNFFKTTHSLVQFISENTAEFTGIMNRAITEIVQYRCLGHAEILQRKFENMSNET